MKQKGRLLLMVAVLSGVVALIGTVDALSEVKVVTIIIVVAGAFSSRAALVSAIHTLKESKENSS